MLNYRSLDFLKRLIRKILHGARGSASTLIVRLVESEPQQGEEGVHLGEACLDTTSVIESDVDAEAFTDAVEKTVHASETLSLEFSDFMGLAGRLTITSIDSSLQHRVGEVG